MANNFSSTQKTVSSNSETTVITTTSNKQIVVGLNLANTGSSSIDVDVKVISGGDSYYVVKDVSIPINSKVEIVKGKLVLGSGNQMTVQSSASGGDLDVIISLLTDVS
tara:strand:+ start:25786 stop:26109 length:324 start_codon:yes stop_codon:yes gene_type:complete